MHEQRTFVFVSLISSVVSGLAVAMTLLYFSGSSRPPGAAPAAASRASDHTAAPATHPPLEDTVAGSGVSHPPTVPAPRPLPRSQTRPPVSQAQFRQHQAELQHLKQRLQQLERSRTAPADAAEEGQAQTGAELTPEEGRAAELAQWEETKMRFAREAVDTPWASATTPLFAADIEGLVEQAGFALVHTECRSTQCAAVLAWPSYDEAVQGFTTLVHHSYQANCARETLLPSPWAEETAQPYHMTIIFDCSTWRQQG